VEDVDRSHRSLARSLLAAGGAGEGMGDTMEDFVRGRGRAAENYRELLQEIGSGDDVPLAAYAVAVRALAEVATG
jgi:NAD-specific glutamate dehydrogenase